MIELKYKIYILYNMYSEKVIPILKEAGKDLAKYFGNVAISDKKEKMAYSVVTDLDLKTEKFIAKELKKVYPSIDFFGEEFGGNKKSDRFWLVDPIDGTAHFVRGMPFCTTMISLVEFGEVIFSAIYDFIKGDVYYAEKGKGARKNNEKISVSNRSLVDSYMTFEIDLTKKENLDIFLSLKNKSALFKTISCGYEYVLIAQGKIEGRISIDPYGHDWDYAPGSFLVKEAGGAVFNLKKDSYNFKNHNHFAGNPVVYEELKRLYKF